MYEILSNLEEKYVRMYNNNIFLELKQLSLYFSVKILSNYFHIVIINNKINIPVAPPVVDSDYVTIYHKTLSVLYRS